MFANTAIVVLLVVLCVAFIWCGLQLIAIHNGLHEIACSNHEIAHAISIHSETLNEIKHVGTGIDNDMTPGEKVLAQIQRGERPFGSSINANKDFMERIHNRVFGKKN